MKTPRSVIKVLSFIAIATSMLIVANCKQPGAESLLQDAATTDPAKGCENEWKELQRFQTASNQANAEESECKAAGGSMGGDVGCVCGTTPGSGSTFDPKKQTCKNGVLGARQEDPQTAACQRAGGTMQDACMCLSASGGSGSSFDPATHTCRNGTATANASSSGGTDAQCNRGGGRFNPSLGECECPDGTAYSALAAGQNCGQRPPQGGTDAQCNRGGGRFNPSLGECECPDGTAYSALAAGQNCGQRPPQGGTAAECVSPAFPTNNPKPEEACMCPDGITLIAKGASCGMGLTEDMPSDSEGPAPTDLPAESGAPGFSLAAPVNLQEAKAQYDQCKQRSASANPTAERVTAFQNACKNQGGEYRMDDGAMGGHKCTCLSTGGTQAISGYSGGATVFQNCPRVDTNATSSEQLTTFQSSCRSGGGTYVEVGRKCKCSNGSGETSFENFLSGGGMLDREENIKRFCGTSASSSGGSSTGNTDEQGFRAACRAGNSRITEGSSPLQCTCQPNGSMNSLTVWVSSGRSPNHFINMCGRAPASPVSAPAVAPAPRPAPAPAQAQQYRGNYCVPRLHQGMCGVINCNGAQSTCRYTSWSRGSTNADCENRCRQWYPSMPKW